MSLARVLSPEISIKKSTRDRVGSGCLCQVSLSSESVFEVSSQILCYLRQQNFGANSLTKLEQSSKM